ncbi:MAG TPA: helix-turn-helix transcriptional regulator [Streptosporangiaceae bacterium]|jgi:transcriptional regulator with XRE-family HTH domain
MTDRAAGPAVLRILLGTQLRRLREARGVTAQQAAQAIRGSESKISRIELGRNAVREVDVADLLSLYGVTDPAEREQLLSVASQANQPGWWHRYQDVLPGWFQAYVGLEESAESIRSYDSQFVPGLLQTEDYAAAVLALGEFSADETERLVLLRKERQRRFLSAGQQLQVIVDESALRRPVGSTMQMRAQLEHLDRLCAQRVISLQVLPSPGAYIAPTSFSILRFAPADLPDIVYIEQLTSAMYLDKRSDVDRYTEVMDRLGAASASAEDSRRIIRALRSELRGAA